VSSDAAAPSAVASGDGGCGVRVLVAENIGRSGIELLRERFAVELGSDWSREQLALAERIGDQGRLLWLHPVLIREEPKPSTISMLKYGRCSTRQWRSGTVCSFPESVGARLSLSPTLTVPPRLLD